MKLVHETLVPGKHTSLRMSADHRLISSLPVQGGLDAPCICFHLYSKLPRSFYDFLTSKTICLPSHTAIEGTNNKTNKDAKR